MGRDAVDESCDRAWGTPAVQGAGGRAALDKARTQQFCRQTGAMLSPCQVAKVLPNSLGSQLSTYGQKAKQARSPAATQLVKAFRHQTPSDNSAQAHTQQCKQAGTLDSLQHNSTNT